MKPALLALLLCATFTANSQTAKVLHYSETSGFDHNTRAESLAMFQDILTGYFIVDDDQTGDAFNSLSNLQQYELIVFSNTSGDNILDANQRANFEAYINAGGSFLGIHAASDTYRHSSANGTNTGTWDFYAELVGASVQQNPNHVAGTPQYEMTHVGTHNSTSNIPNPWVKNEEYYYWENGYFGTDNISVLQVEETVGPNNMVNSYDAPRPMSWYRELSGGGSMFYTALGHAASNFTSDQNFRTHIRDAIFSLVDIPTELSESKENQWLKMERSDSQLAIYLNGKAPEQIVLYDMFGRECVRTDATNILRTENLSAGLYLLQVSNGTNQFINKVFIQ